MSQASETLRQQVGDLAVSVVEKVLGDGLDPQSPAEILQSIAAPAKATPRDPHRVHDVGRSEFISQVFPRSSKLSREKREIESYVVPQHNRAAE